MLYGMTGRPRPPARRLGGTYASAPPSAHAHALGSFSSSLSETLTAASAACCSSSSPRALATTAAGALG